LVDVVWLDGAKSDARSLFDYIAAEPPAAERYLTGLEISCERLAAFPEIGRRYDDRFRFIVYRNHLIFHRFDPSTSRVLISSVIDGRRDLEDVIGQRDAT
jgi:plasmid stabilization system protein ParE